MHQRNPSMGIVVAALGHDRLQSTIVAAHS
jgi:hypothetical protein